MDISARLQRDERSVEGADAGDGRSGVFCGDDDVDDENARPVGTGTPAPIEAPRSESGDAGAPAQSRQQQRPLFDSNKAGLSQVDKTWANRLIHEVSQHTRFHQHQQQEHRRVEGRVRELVQSARSLDAARLRRVERRLDDEHCSALMLRFGAGRPTHVHVDMDAFFCAVEELDHPELRGRPHAVGGLGMLCTASYEARRFGVRSAMPGFIARRLCPQLIFDKPSFGRYKEVSAQVHEVLRFFDPGCRMNGLDEANMNIANYLSSQPESTIEEVVASIRSTMRERVSVTCSIGVGANFFLAKIATDMAKPDGQTIIAPDLDSVLRFLHPLPVRKVPGIGKVLEEILQALDIVTIGDIYRQRALLHELLPAKSSTFLLNAALGAHSRERAAPRRSFSHERTFKATSNKGELRGICRQLCELLGASLQRNDMSAQLLTVKIKQSSFAVRTRSHKLAEPVSDGAELFDPAWELLERELPLDIRLLGVQASNLRGSAEDAERGAGHAAVPARGAKQRRIASFFRNRNDPSPPHGVSSASVEVGSCATSPASAAGGEHVRAAREAMMCPVCCSFRSSDETEIMRHADECVRRRGG